MTGEPASEIFPYAEAEGSPIIALVAELDAEEVERIVAVAARLRRHLQDERRRAALHAVYEHDFADLRVSAASREIAAAIRGDRAVLVDSDKGRRAAARRPAARQRLESLAGGLDQLRIGAHRIRQILEPKKRQI